MFYFISLHTFSFEILKNINMKKKNIGGLSLKKNCVSNLNDLSKVVGGSTRDVCYSLSACAIHTCAFTCGNCIQTWGDPGCPTGWKGLCAKE